MENEERLFDFMQDTVKSLSRIEANQKNLSEDLSEVRQKCTTCFTKIPLIEQGLNNHLSSHNNLKAWFVWPVTIAIIGIILTLLAGAIFKIRI